MNPGDNNDAPRWRGINHLALVTSDMDKTVRFYHGVLGMRIVAGIIQQGMDTGRIRTVPIRPAVYLFIGAMNGVSQWFKPEVKAWFGQR